MDLRECLRTSHVRILSRSLFTTVLQTDMISFLVSLFIEQIWRIALTFASLLKKKNNHKTTVRFFIILSFYQYTACHETKCTFHLVGIRLCIVISYMSFCISLKFSICFWTILSLSFRLSSVGVSVNILI